MQPALSKTRPVRKIDATRPDERGFVCLPSPSELRRRLPLPTQTRARIDQTRRAIHDILHGHDPKRMVVVVGPCSIHDRGSALVYAKRLAEVAERHEAELVVVMRTYLEKPRSELGWKGFLNDPDLDGRCDAARGIEVSRELLLEIGALGVACASELVDPIAARYLEDLLSWTAIGARTVRSQIHRELASGLPAPVGIKNGIDGDVDAAIAAARVSNQPHAALCVDDSGRAAVRRTRGNADAHIVLRGGKSGPNYSREAVCESAARARSLGLVRPLFVDCSHDNSGKDHRRQGAALDAVLDQVRDGSGAIAGVLLESHLGAGRQAWLPGRPADPNRSITDSCIGWEETETRLADAAKAVRDSR